MHPMAADDHSPVGHRPGADLRGPAAVASAQDLIDLPGLGQHLHRRDQGRQQDLEQGRGEDAHPPAGIARQGPPPRAQRAEQLGQQQKAHRGDEQPQHPAGIKHRPCREQLIGAGEIFRRGQQHGCRQDQTDKDQRQPDRAHQKAHDADDEMHTADGAHPAHPEQAAVLQVALRPTAFAGGHVQQGGRAALIAAAQVVIQPHLPARPAQRRRLDEIMAEDGAAEGRLARQAGQSAALGECGDADDGVVAPEIADIARPRSHPPRDQRAIDPARELRQPGKDRLAAHQHRHGLDQGELRVGLHPQRQFADGLAAHDAVGVQHHHLVIAPAPSADEFRDIAGLAVDVVFAPAIPDRQRRQFARRRDRLRFGDGDGRVAAVGQHEDLGPVGHAFGRDLFRHRCQQPHRDGRVLVIDRHDDDQPRLTRPLGGAVAGGEQPGQRGKEGKAHPGEGRHEQDQQGDLHRRRIVAEGDQHLLKADPCRRRGAAKGDQPRHPCAGPFKAPGPCAVGPGAEILLGHFQRGLGRQRGQVADRSRHAVQRVIQLSLRGRPSLLRRLA